MNKGGVLEDTWGKIGELGGQLGKDIVGEPKDLVKVAVQQVGGEDQEKVDVKNANEQQQALKSNSDKANKEFIKALYAKSDIKPGGPTSQVALAIKEKHPDETPKEILKRTEDLLRQHQKEYFEKTFNPKKKEEPRAAEKAAKEEEEKKKKQIQALQLEKQKKEEVSSPFMKHGTHETYPGVGG